jgi:3-methyladenine DNA glycosylase
MASYCDIAASDPLHRAYHDREYGFPVEDEAVLFERLSLEIFQAGLTWRLVLQRRLALSRGFAGFDPERVAAFGADEQAALLADPSIIRNRRKIESIVANATTMLQLREEAGGFNAWLRRHHPRSEADWVRLFKQTFRFMGPEIVREFLLSTGYLAGAHRGDCPIHAEITALRPPWLSVEIQ